MGQNDSWEKLCDIRTLRRGWHITREDMGRDFTHEPYARETFACSLEENLKEISRLLLENDFRSHYLLRVSVPKGNLGTRPGTILPIEDRVILFSALTLVADTIYDNIDREAVYSYRLKEKKKRKDSIFVKNGDDRKVPFLEGKIFLKGKTIRKYFIPFQPWYENWVEFEKDCQKAFLDDGYNFLATSDIAAYFENIQLDILRDQLASFLPNEPKIVNLFLNSFTSWTYDTPQGRNYSRGIPQGSDISSLFGNIFLQPIDSAFDDFVSSGKIKYFRYMDDIRIFAKSEIDAKRAIFLLNSKIRELHLNLQNAKTKIYNENSKEITNYLIDKRLIKIEAIDGEIKKEIKALSEDEDLDKNFINNVKQEIGKILKDIPDSKEEQTIHSSRKPLDNLTGRVFRRLVTMHIQVGDYRIVQRIVNEVIRNSEQKMTLKLITCSQQFPRTDIQLKLLKFINSEESIFLYQKAQILKAFRYQSRIKEDVIEYVKKYLNDGLQNASKQIDDRSDDIVYAEMFYLLSRCKLENKEFKYIKKIAEEYFESNSNDIVKKSASLILIRQSGKKNLDFIKSMVFHPNENIRKLGVFYRSIKNDKAFETSGKNHAGNKKSNSKDKIGINEILNQALNKEADFLAVDYLPLLYMIAESTNKSIVEFVVKRIKDSKAHKNHKNMDAREQFKYILERAGNRIRNWQPQKNNNLLSQPLQKYPAKVLSSKTISPQLNMFKKS